MSRRIAFVFPGQGSQTVGMGKDVYESSPAARAVFELADRALGFPLSQICFEGPEETLRETINTQPALVTTSLAFLAALQEAAGAPLADGEEPALRRPLRPSFVAGHSVGEYSALATAGAFSIAEALRLVRERGQLMHQEGTQVESGMAAVLGMDRAALAPVCEEATTQARSALGAQANAPEMHPGAGRVVVANDNAPGQLVISGSRDALERAMELARAAGAKRVVPLTVSGAFHSPVMGPASEQMARVVADAAIADADIPVIANITARPMQSATEIREELARQIASPVQWTRTVEYLAAEGVDTFVEIGAGQVLSGLIKRIAKGVTILSVGAVTEVAPVAEQLQALLSE